MMNHAIADGSAIVPLMNDLAWFYADEQQKADNAKGDADLKRLPRLPRKYMPAYYICIYMSMCHLIGALKYERGNIYIYI